MLFVSALILAVVAADVPEGWEQVPMHVCQRAMPSVSDGVFMRDDIVCLKKTDTRIGWHFG